MHVFRFWEFGLKTPIHAPKLGVLGGKWGRGGAILTPNELGLTFGSLHVCVQFGENRRRNATVRVSTDGQIHTRTHAQTDAKRFYYLSHAICYSYGADKNTILQIGRPHTGTKLQQRTDVKHRPHQQQCRSNRQHCRSYARLCRSNIRLCCHKRRQCRTSIVEFRSFDKVECCFHNVAVFWQQSCQFRQQCRTNFLPFDKVETN